MVTAEGLLPLPARNDRLAGESTDTKQNYSLSVSNADGYLCHLTATCYFHATPEAVYAIFINPGAVPRRIYVSLLPGCEIGLKPDS